MVPTIWFSPTATDDEIITWLRRTLGNDGSIPVIELGHSELLYAHEPTWWLERLGYCPTWMVGKPAHTWGEVLTQFPQRQGGARVIATVRRG